MLYSSIDLKKTFYIRTSSERKRTRDQQTERNFSYTLFLQFFSGTNATRFLSFILLAGHFGVDEDLVDKHSVPQMKNAWRKLLKILKILFGIHKCIQRLNMIKEKKMTMSVFSPSKESLRSH